jgi:hypothetical protein
VQTCGARKRDEVGCVRGEDVVAIAGEEHERGIDHVDLPCLSQQNTGTPTDGVVEPTHVDRRQEAGQVHLPAATSTPDLSDHAAMCQGHASMRRSWHHTAFSGRWR